MEAVRPKPKSKKKSAGKEKGRSRTKNEKASSRQRSKPPTGATADVENQPANSDEPAAKTDSHSSSQSDAKSDSRSNVAEVAKDAVTTELLDDEVVKSKPLPSVSQGRSEDDVATVGNDPLPDTREAPPISQTSSPAERYEIHTLELEPTHVTVDTKSLQGESTLELEHEKEGENVITTKSLVVNRQEVGVVSPKLEAAVETESSVLPSAPALIDFCTDMDEVGGAEIVGVSDITGQSAEVVEEGNKILYPRLDSIMREQQEHIEELEPFTEEDLSILYPNPQLDNQAVFVDAFIRMSNQEHHELYELLMTYLKAIQALSNSQKHLEALRSKYHTHQVLLWHTESKQITSTGRCGHNTKVSHSHSYKYATFNRESAGQVNLALKETRELLQEELCMHTYSSQLARIHVEHYLFQLMQSYPELNGLPEDAPATSWVPSCPPGGMDSHNAHLRDCISVLFMFIRKPVVNAKFSDDCQHWLDILLSALLRVATLSDHQFIFHHLLRCPPGVGKWGARFLRLLSPLHTRQMLEAQYKNIAPPLNFNAVTMETGFTQDWGVGLGLHGDWGGPVLDHFMTMLATLLLPIKERDVFLPEVDLSDTYVVSTSDFSRSISQPWVFVEETDEDEADSEGSTNLLKESDFISFFDQFPFSELYQYILAVPSEGDYNTHSTTSYQMLRLLAFSTCLIRLLGAAFTTLKLARYKEFIKRIGRTIRVTVQFVADHWVTYKAHRLSCGDTMASLPPDMGHGDPRYSLNRLQLEFDQFVLRATKWILTAHKQGAWQFLAIMPYGSISLKTAWMVFWNIYCKDQLSSRVGGANQSAPSSGCGNEEEEGSRGERERIMSPSNVEEIQVAIRGGGFKDQFVDRLMKTYTSEAVFLLTTLVNMARARPSDSDQEREFINTIVLEIFECTHVVEYARETYSRTGSNLLGAIAIVHPFVVSTLLKRATTPTTDVRENCILLFKELPLHLWLPESHDVHVIHNLLTEHPLSSCQNMLARVIISGMNWGTKSEEGSLELVLPWSLHCSVALMLVEAHSKLLPTQPGGRDYVPVASSLRNYASLHRFIMSSEQQEFATWAWEAGLMLKLHPNQLLSRSSQTLSPAGECVDQPAQSHLSEPSWVHVNEGGEEIVLPDLTSSGERELADLRDAVKYEGLLAYYVAMCVTSIGTDTDHFIASGLSMMNRMIDQGYYLPALRVLANCTPQLFKHGKVLVEDSNFPQIVLAISNADIANASLKERWTFSTPTPLVAKKMAALLQTQVQGACRPGGVGGDTVLRFWLDILLSWPTWLRERSVLLLLDTLCRAAFNEPTWQKMVMDRMIEHYRLMDPTQPKRSLLSSVYSSVASMVGQDGGPPSIFNAVPRGEYVWLSYTALSAEQLYEEEEGVWKALLQQLKQDAKISIESALKKAFSDLKTQGGFSANHLCIYRWAEFCSEIDHTHPLYSLVWQRFFMLYLQRPQLDQSSMPDRESFGIRFFASTRALSIRRQMKNSLSSTCKKLQTSIREQEGGGGAGGEMHDLTRAFLPKLLKLCQTYRNWLEDPRLHTASLYLPGLPQQYESDRLVSIFQADKARLWTEFIPQWEIRAEINRMVAEWIEVAAYQKQLRSKAYPPESSPDSAVIRIRKRLQKKSTPLSPPPFHYCSAPFTLLSPDLLFSQDSLLAVVHTDVDYLKQQAKSFCTKVDALVTLDRAYESGVPRLYTNEPRQFHVRVPCRPGRFSTAHQCDNPATIVFRFDEMTINPQFDQQLQVNRSEYNSMVSDLCTPINKDLCPIITRLEHVVTELSKLSDQNQGSQINVPLQCGIALFYKIVEFITPEIRRFPPTCQILTTCLQLLGQEFVGRDPLQTTNLLQLLLTQHGKSDLIVPLFQPNQCPEDFLQMYASAAEICAKEGPTIAFSVLTKFNIVEWVESYNPGMGERLQLLDFINQGLTLYGTQASNESGMLVEVYRRHFVHLVDYQFPDLYFDALQLVISGTDNANIVLDVWTDLCHVICSTDTSRSCRLGLQQACESIKVLSSHYLELRGASEQTLYSIIAKEYVPLVGKFIELLCIAVATKWKNAIAEETAKPVEAISSCWKSILDVFLPWISSMTSSSNATLPPCLDSEVEQLKTVMTLFVTCVSEAHAQLRDPLDSVSIMGLMWGYYCDTLVQPSTPGYLLSAYHSALERLPWSTFFPSLAAMDSMMKLSLTNHPSSFVFLGQIFPLLDWKTIGAEYSDVSRQSDPSSPVQFHIMFLQVLLMLAAERRVMEREGTGIPEVLAEAQTLHWEFIDSKTYKDILSWQKNNCDPSSILQTGSCLSLCLRLLKAVAGFPTSSGPPHVQHNNTWEKRLAYFQVTVELIAACSEKKSTHDSSYTEPISHLFETAVDIAVQEPSEIGGPNLLAALQEILNLLNISSPAGGMTNKITVVMHDIMDQMSGIHVLALTIITAGCRVLASLHTMVLVVEHTINCFFSNNFLPPQSTSLELPPDATNGYGWKFITGALALPEDSTDEVYQHCLSECATLIIHAQLLKDMPYCTSIEQEYKIAVKMVRWCTQLKPKPVLEAKIFLLWEKALGLLLRQVQFVGNHHELIPHFTTLATSMIRFGEDKATDGILGVIGLGKKTCYSHRFRLVSRAMAAYLHCQMPVDSRQTTLLRVMPNAPGHVKDPLRVQHAGSNVSPTKQGTNTCASLEALLTDKHYVALRDHANFAVNFVTNPANSIVNCNYLLVYLSTTLYPEARYLDLLRVLQV